MPVKSGRWVTRR